MDDGMAMMMDVPGWLTALAWTWVALCLASAALLALTGRRGAGPMALVWPVSALYLGPVAVLLHRRWGRTGRTPRDAATGLAGGAASTLAHVVGVPLVVAGGLRIAGVDLWPMILVIAVLATAILAVLEVAAGHRPGRALVLALATVLAFDVGMGGWMLLLHFGEAMPEATHVAFWFLMQVGVVLGTLTALPLVRRLVAREPAAAVTA